MCKLSLLSRKKFLTKHYKKHWNNIMKYILRLFPGVLAASFLFPHISHAEVKFNEIAWMGTTNSQYSEWIELYNSGSDAVPLAGWTIYKTGNALLFTLTKTIAAGGYLLIEHTTPSAPDAVPGINDESGTFGAGGLKNSGEDLILKDKSGTAIDTLSFANGWPAGDAKTKDTMQWNGQKWITAPGTPDAQNAATTVTPVVIPPQSQTQSVQTAPLQQPAVTTITSVPIVSTPPVITAPTEDTTITTPITALPEPTPTPPTENDSAYVVAPIEQQPTAASTTSKIKIPTKKARASSSNSTTMTDTDNAEANASPLQDTTSTDSSKENNHIKIIILAVVALIGIGLFLLLARIKASKE
jgi:hypothetical protein